MVEQPPPRTCCPPRLALTAARMRSFAGQLVARLEPGLLGAVGSIALIVAFVGCASEPEARHTQQPATEVPAGQPPDPDPTASPAATPAPVTSPIALARWGDYEVRLRRAHIDQVQVVELYTKDRKVSNDRHLVLNLEIENLNEARKAQVLTWGHLPDTLTSARMNEQQKRALATALAKLTDEHGNTYDQPSWSDVFVVGQITVQSALYSGRPVGEVLVFEPPVKKAEWLTLKLPAHNFMQETDHVIALTIPTSAIEGR